MGEADDHPYYYTTNSYNGYDPSAYSPYDRVMKRPDYYQDYWGFDLIFNKRLSNRWMVNGSFTFQNQKVHYGDEGYMSATNLWALDNRVYSPYQGGASGKINQYTGCHIRSHQYWTGGWEPAHTSPDIQTGRHFRWHPQSVWVTSCFCHIFGRWR